LVTKVAGVDVEFRLGWGQLVTLQETCDAGPFVILNRLADGSWKTDDIAATLVLGLVGAGRTHMEALGIVEGWLDEKNGRLPVENLTLAQAVLGASLVGAPDEPLGKAAAADQKIA
jgi:hypothetical protein